MNLFPRIARVSAAAVLAAGLCFGAVAAEPAKPAAAPAKPAAATVPYHEFIEGNPKATVTVTEYASVTCPHCARFYMDVYPELKKAYIDTGKIKFIFRDFPTPPQNLALAAAALARCAPGDGGPKMLDLLFNNQQEWIPAPNEKLRAYAKTVGMADADVDACLENEALLTEMQSVMEKAVTLYQIQYTPTLLVGDAKIEGEVSFENLAAAIDKQLAGGKKK